MPDSLASSPRYRNEEKNAFDGISPVTEEGDIQSGNEMLRYWTELPYAGMPAPSTWIPMPNYGNETVNIASSKNIKIIGYNQCEKD